MPPCLEPVPCTPGASLGDHAGHRHSTAGPSPGSLSVPLKNPNPQRTQTHRKTQQKPPERGWATSATFTTENLTKDGNSVIKLQLSPCRLTSFCSLAYWRQIEPTFTGPTRNVCRAHLPRPDGAKQRLPLSPAVPWACSHWGKGART